MKQRTRITAKMEQKMQELRAQGKSTKEIAAVVGVSETAVRTHTTGIVVPEDEKQARVEADVYKRQDLLSGQRWRSSRPT